MFHEPLYSKTPIKGNLRMVTPDIEEEEPYPPWWTTDGLGDWYRELPDEPRWNCYICAVVLLALVWVIAEISNIYIDILDVIYNLSYAFHVFAIGYKLLTEMEYTEIKGGVVVGFIIDMVSYSHFASKSLNFKLFCYFLRLHRPFKYLFFSNEFHHKGSVLGTTLKFCYIFFVLRVILAWIWLHVEKVEGDYLRASTRRFTTKLSDETQSKMFLTAVYVVNKMFIPIGASATPDNDLERLVCILVMIAGCVVVGGAAVATLSLVFSLYMRPEESFRARYRLIMKDMKDSHVSQSLVTKVETFYNMYWQKQRAVSKTSLLPTFPPTLPASIYTDVYFEATQKARILRQLDYQMLSEVSKMMETVHYIPGDSIIQRGTTKSSMIYITYGDVEMLTAEDDSTALVRMTRGTLLTAASGAAAAACAPAHVAVRAATFCTAHVLPARFLWHALTRHSVTQDHAGPVLAAFNDHIERVKRHYMMKEPDDAIYKSSILKFNRNLMDLKELRDESGKALLAGRDIFLEVAGCYIMRNSAHLSLADESDEICLRSTFPYILQPSSSLLVAWHSLVALLILIVCITHPYYLVFRKTVPLEFRFFDYMVTTVFVIDLIVHLSTGTNLEEGGAITFGQTSSQQMRSHWFVMDVLATFPIFEFCGEGHFAGINKILRLPSVFRVLKSLEETYVYHSNFIRFMSYSFLLVIACYLIAALQQSFMCFQSGYCQVTNLTHSPYWEKKPLDEETVLSRLLFGLYWAISMLTFTTHMETWGKENWNNVLYTLGILEVCIVLRIFMEAVYSATIMVTTTLREEYDSLIATVKKFLIRNQIDPQLRNRFMTYLQLCWYTDKAYKITHRKTYSIFHDLPSHVYQDIVGKNRIKYLLCIPFMRLLKTEELKTVSSAATIFYTSPNEILLNTGDLSNEMYIIKKGICEVICPITKISVGHLSAKNHFGAVICLLRLPSYYTVRAVTHVQVLCISRKHLISALLDNVVTDSADFVKSLPEYQRLTKRYPSFLTYTPPPPTPNRMFFRLPMKHESDAEFLYPFTRLGFLSILRYVFPRFTIRPDGKYLINYELFRVGCAVISAMTFPAYTYLVLQWPWLYYFALLLDISAWFDIFQRMLIGYFNEFGILVYHPASTAAYYMKGAFIMDLFGCLPLENLESARKEMFGKTIYFYSLEENRYRVTPTKQLLMMNRLLQLYRFPSAMLLLKDYFERHDLVMVIQVMPILIPLFNALVSLMIYSSVSIYYSVNIYDEITDFLIVPFDDPGGSWINLFSDTFRFNLTSSPWNLHLATYFWITYECTTVGYNSIGASNFRLLELLVVGIFCSTMIMTYFSVRIISARANVDKALAGFQQHMKDIDFYMMKENLDEELQKSLYCSDCITNDREIHRYYEYNWEKMGGINYRGMLKLCDQITLRTDAILHIYGHTFGKCPLLSQADVSLLRMLGRAIRSVYFLRDMKIIENDDVVHDIYFVDYGGVEARLVADYGDLSTCIRLPRGSVFGNLNDSKAGRYPLNIIATSRLHLLIIKTEIFYSIIRDFPSVKILLEKYRNVDSPYYILGNINQATVKLRRDRPETDHRPRKGFIKTIYYQDGLVQIYLIVISMACIYADVYNAGFQNNQLWLIYALYILDLCFFLKIVMQVLLPLLVINKNIKRILLPIRHMYFKHEFRYDILSCVPFELLSFISAEHGWMLFSWFRLNRMFRIDFSPLLVTFFLKLMLVTVYNCLKRRNERITVNLTTFAAVAGSIWFSLFVHIITCVWYFIGLMIDHYHENTSWMYTDDGRSLCSNNYICSLYFIITTVSQNGIGDIIPRNRTEVVYVIVIQIMSMLMLMVYVGEFSNIVQRHSFRSFNFFSKYLELQEYLKNNRVSSNLVRIVNKYTLHLWRETRGQQVPKFLTEAPASLRLRVMSNIYQHHVARHHIFEDCEQGFMRQLVGCLRLFTYNEGMYVVKENEITNSMYLIHTGKIKETREDKTVSTRIYPAGSYFGILQGLLRDSPYTHSYQTVTKSQVLTLNLDDWEYLLDHFPRSRDSIYKHMSHVTSKDVSSKRWPGGGPSAPSKEPPPPGTTGSAIIHNIPPGKLRRAQSSTHTRPSTHTAFRPTTSESPEDLQSQLLEPSLSRDLSTVIDPNVGQRKIGFLGRINQAARKIMEKLTESDELNYVSASRTSIEAKDELLLEEEEDATLALLKQYDEATRRSRAFRRKSGHKLRQVLAKQEEERQREEESQREESTLYTGAQVPRPNKPGDKTARFASQFYSPSQVDTLADNATTENTVDLNKYYGTGNTSEQTKEAEIDIEKIRGTYDVTRSDPSSNLSIAIGSQDSIISLEIKAERPSRKMPLNKKTPPKSKTTPIDNKKDKDELISLQSLETEERAISHNDDSEKLDDTKPESLVNVIDLEKVSHNKIETTPDSLPESLIVIKDLDRSDTTKEVSETEETEHMVSRRESFMAMENLEKSESVDAKDVVDTKTVDSKSNQGKKISQQSLTPSFKQKSMSSGTTVYKETDYTDKAGPSNKSFSQKTVDERSKRDKKKRQLSPTPSFIEENPIVPVTKVNKTTDLTDKAKLSYISQSEKTFEQSSKKSPQRSPTQSLKDNSIPSLTRVYKNTNSIDIASPTQLSQSDKTVDEGAKNNQEKTKLQLLPTPSFEDNSNSTLKRVKKEIDYVGKAGPSGLSQSEKSVDEGTERDQDKKKLQVSSTISLVEKPIPPLAKVDKNTDNNNKTGPSKSDKEIEVEASEQREGRRVRYKEKETSVLEIARMESDNSMNDVHIPWRPSDRAEPRDRAKARKRGKIKPEYDDD